MQTPRCTQTAGSGLGVLVRLGNMLCSCAHLDCACGAKERELGTDRCNGQVWGPASVHKNETLVLKQKKMDLANPESELAV